MGDADQYLIGPIQTCDNPSELFADFLSELKRLELLPYARMIALRLFSHAELEGLDLPEQRQLIEACEPFIMETHVQTRRLQ